MSETLILKSRYADGTVKCWEAKDWKEGYLSSALAHDGLVSIEDMMTGEVRTAETGYVDPKPKFTVADAPAPAPAYTPPAEIIEGLTPKPISKLWSALPFIAFVLIVLFCALAYGPAKAAPPAGYCDVVICNKLERFSLNPMSHLKDSWGEQCMPAVLSVQDSQAGKVLDSGTRWYQGSFNPTKQSVTRVKSVGACTAEPHVEPPAAPASAASQPAKLHTVPSRAVKP